MVALLSCLYFLLVGTEISEFYFLRDSLELPELHIGVAFFCYLTSRICMQPLIDLELKLVVLINVCVSKLKKSNLINNTYQDAKHTEYMIKSFKLPNVP